MTRRRFIRITGIAAGCALLPPAAAIGGASQAGHLKRWQGVALGADASLQLFHPDPAEAARLVAASLAEVRRLERIFSLYNPGSALSRLNRDGRLDEPPPELVELLAAASAFSRLTDGAFDATVQPLWELHAAHFARPDADPAGPDAAALAEAKARVGHAAVRIEPGLVRFARPGVRVTLNGIAQGYITDRVTDLLRAAGIGHTLVDMGEMRALDEHPDRRPWSVGLRDPRDAARLLATIPLRNAAIATSSGCGTPLDAAGRFNHIFDPATGASATRYLAVSVEAATATAADALSTAFTLMPVERARQALAAAGAARAWFVAGDGGVTAV